MKKTLILNRKIDQTSEKNISKAQIGKIFVKTYDININHEEK